MANTRQLDQQRSAFALKAATGNAGLKKVAEGLPVALRTQGLLVTLARLQAGDENEKQMAKQVTDWLIQQPHLGLSQSELSAIPDLLNELLNLERSSYLAIQAEAQRLVERIKLFCQALHNDAGGNTA